MAFELVKENIEYEQLLRENSMDTVLKAEYVIPDTLPDVMEILMLDANPVVTNAEVMGDKVYVEGAIIYNVMYLSKTEEKNKVYSVSYNGKFSNYIEISGANHKMNCETECFLEQLQCNIVNERKVSLDGILGIKVHVYQNSQIDIVKDIKGSNDVQLLKSPVVVDKIMGTLPLTMVGKSHMQIPMEKPQIDSILKCNVNLHKKDVKLSEGKIIAETFAQIIILYKCKDSDELESISDDVLLRQEGEMQNIDSSMEPFYDFFVDSSEYEAKDDDLGEKRIIDVEVLSRCFVKVICKEEVDMIEDAYSPVMVMNMDKKDYDINVLHGSSSMQTIVKDNIEALQDMPKPLSVVMYSCRTCITDKKVMEDKVAIEGLLYVDVLYKSADEDKPLCKINEEIPFNCAVEVPGCKIDMHALGKVSIESMDISVEAETIGIKVVVMVCINVNYSSHKEFLINIDSAEGEVPSKKASVTIYVVQQGDTIWKIAKKYTVTIDKLIKLNNIENPDNILPGQKLIIPGRAII